MAYGGFTIGLTNYRVCFFTPKRPHDYQLMPANKSTQPVIYLSIVSSGLKLVEKKCDKVIVENCFLTDCDKDIAALYQLLHM
jgi:hypothetical protein